MIPRYRFRQVLALAIVLHGFFATLALADDNSSWMGSVPDNIYVSQLSIPGAHDAGTGHGTGADDFGRTQDLTLTAMWNSGVRVFDLRPSVDGSRLRIYHGILSTNLYFDDALSTLCGLLDEHPSEFCIVLMRHEDDSDDGSTSWNGMVTTLLKSELVSSHAVNFDPRATLGSVRGKLLILSRDAYASRPIGGFITGWGHNSDFGSQQSGKLRGVATAGSLYVQDFYDVSASGAAATKQQSVQRMLQFSSSENTDPAVWVVNHTSGYTKTFFGIATRDGYRDNASTQNAAVLDYLGNHSGSAGIVIMDYAGVDRSGNYDVRSQALTDALIAQNTAEGPFTDYFRALAAIENGHKYCVFTEVDDVKYYLTADGYLTADAALGGQFTFARVAGEAYAYGFNLKDAYFTNPPVGGSPKLDNGHIDTNTQRRKTWEAQVFLLNAEGKYAVRATNAAGGTSGWAVNAQTFWTVTPDAAGPKAEYAVEPAYVWKLEDAEGLTAISRQHSDSQSAGIVVDMAGRRVQQPVHGLYVVDGRKIVKQ